MAGEFVATLGDISQFSQILKGEYVQGRNEPRVALVGRSNVGKSTLLNALLGTRLAQTSKQPGKTRCVHFYLWKEAKKLIADLPGYGFARAAKSERSRWGKFVQAYLKRDPGLELVLVLLDSRHGPTDLDKEAIRFIAECGVPMVFVFTKVDAIKNQKERASRKKKVDTFLQEFEESQMGALAGVFWVSAKSKAGLKPLMLSLRGDV